MSWIWNLEVKKTKTAWHWYAHRRDDIEKGLYVSLVCVKLTGHWRIRVLVLDHTCKPVWAHEEMREGDKVNKTSIVRRVKTSVEARFSTPLSVLVDSLA